LHDAFFWGAFFGAPLFLIVMTAVVFRSSARVHYREVKQAIFDDHQPARRPAGYSVRSDRC
jgi:hypothetical protein